MLEIKLLKQLFYLKMTWITENFSVVLIGGRRSVELLRFLRV